MSKITFRADDNLVKRIEALDASKSEVMREALRAYLGEQHPPSSDPEDGSSSSIDDLIKERVDQVIDRRLETRNTAPDVNVSVSIDDDRTPVRRDNSESVPRSDINKSDRGCNRCGESLEDAHVYCPNCGEKAVNRFFCECGDELRSDWAFCPGCGRRTSAADVLDR